MALGTAKDCGTTTQPNCAERRNHRENSAAKCVRRACGALSSTKPHAGACCIETTTAAFDAQRARAADAVTLWNTAAHDCSSQSTVYGWEKASDLLRSSCTLAGGYEPPRCAAITNQKILRRQEKSASAFCELRPPRFAHALASMYEFPASLELDVN